MKKYPEHNKLSLVKDQSQAIGAFLDWLLEKGVILSKPHEHSDNCLKDGKYVCHTTEGDLVPIWIPIHSWLATYFNIDEYKLEKEKRAMLDEMQKK
jgi:hypothetical protein